MGEGGGEGGRGRGEGGGGGRGGGGEGEGEGGGGRGRGGERMFKLFLVRSGNRLRFSSGEVHEFKPNAPHPFFEGVFRYLHNVSTVM